MGDRQLERVYDPFVTNAVPDTDVSGTYCISIPGPYLSIFVGALYRLLDERLWWSTPGDPDAINHLRVVMDALSNITCAEGGSLDIFAEDCVIYRRVDGKKELVLDVRSCFDPFADRDETTGEPTPPEELYDDPPDGWDGGPSEEDAAGIPDENICAGAVAVVEYVLSEADDVLVLANIGIDGLTSFLDQRGIFGYVSEFLEITWEQLIGFLADYGISLLRVQLNDADFRRDFECALFCEVKDTGEFVAHQTILSALARLGNGVIVNLLRLILNPITNTVTGIFFAGPLVSRRETSIQWRLGVDDTNNDCVICDCTTGAPASVINDILLSSAGATGSAFGAITADGNIVLNPDTDPDEQYSRIVLVSEEGAETEGTVFVRFAAPREINSVQLNYLDRKAQTTDNVSHLSEIVLVSKDGTEVLDTLTFGTRASNTNRRTFHTWNPPTDEYIGMRVRMYVTAIAPGNRPAGTSFLSIDQITINSQGDILIEGG